MGAGSGLISGAAQAASSATYTVSVTDSASPAHTVTSNFTLTVNPALSVSNGVTVIWTSRWGMENRLLGTATGGVPPYTFRLDKSLWGFLYVENQGNQAYLKGYATKGMQMMWSALIVTDSVGNSASPPSLIGFGSGWTW